MIRTLNIVDNNVDKRRLLRTVEWDPGSRLINHNDCRVEIESYILFEKTKREFKQLHCSVSVDISTA